VKKNLATLSLEMVSGMNILRTDLYMLALVEEKSSFTFVIIVVIVCHP